MHILLLYNEQVVTTFSFVEGNLFVYNQLDLSCLEPDAVIILPMHCLLLMQVAQRIGVQV